MLRMVLSKSRRQDWLFAAALAAAVFVVYQPVWRGGFVWDDDAHVTSPELQSWHGLHRIWFDVGATQQYYPLLHNAFWVQHKLWGNATLGYHLANIALHVVVALMAALVLRRLAVPGAFLAAAIFALHPVQVESVAWVTEQKNTLSALFYVGAAICYLRFDEGRGKGAYVGALALFALGLLSKTVTATLPGALLVVFWWQRGRLSWRRDVLPLMPFFLLGAVAGLFTAWVEHELIGAQGADFELPLLERCLLAGRVVWFYLGHLVWPSDLIFIYPRWVVSRYVWWQWLFPVAGLLLVAGLWAIRRLSRGPLAGLLFFVGTLTPVLGFFNVYPFKFSFVADHFQYLASLGVIAVASAGAAMVLERISEGRRAAGYAACLALLATLGTLTWRQSRMYADDQTLYLATIEANPNCWMAHNNLGVSLAEQGKLDEAIIYHRRAVELNPGCAEAWLNFGVTLRQQKKLDEAIGLYQKALEIRPEYAAAHYNFGLALQQSGQIKEAITHYKKAIELWPNGAGAYANLGAAFGQLGKPDEAVGYFRKALEIDPKQQWARRNLDATIAAQQLALDELAKRRELIRARPDDVALLNNTAWVLATSPFSAVRNGAEALELAQRASTLAGDKEPAILGTLAAAYAETGRLSQAVETAKRAVSLATADGNTALADALRKRLKLYESRLSDNETTNRH
jgi:protein O-mannosyl-transferase